MLDTSVVLATGVAPLKGELAISAATLAELHFGVLLIAATAHAHSAWLYTRNARDLRGTDELIEVVEV